MKLDERRKPQDGRFSARIEGRRIDFRVSTFPTAFGEKVVMRILDQEKGVKKLEDIGFTPENLAYVKEALTKPYGLILITGPTGSGKSTTLYSMLNAVDRESMNVLSLEDPVEYNIEGVSQSQVRPEIDYTFANGLRSTLRQDPDIIMVGEIRDKETAQLAVQAALTGHLVFSTLHTNNSAGVIPRLIDMGVDPYLIAPTLVLTIAQRLVSLLCPGGGKKVPVDGAIRAIIDHQFEDLPAEHRKRIKIPETVMEIMPTPECPKGTRGRMAVFELFRMDKDVESQLLKSPTELEISELLRSKGMLSLKEDAILKAFDGLIPFEEVNKL
jgi:type II secretory ATPase GspE/PulE/Tfp pilus assembly ATPase PilB-like protein